MSGPVWAARPEVMGFWIQRAELGMKTQADLLRQGFFEGNSAFLTEVSCLQKQCQAVAFEVWWAVSPLESQGGLAAWWIHTKVTAASKNRA